MRTSFTLIELVIVIAIIGLLSQSAVLSFSSTLSNFKKATEVQDLMSFIKRGQNYALRAQCNMRLEYDAQTKTLTWIAPKKSKDPYTLLVDDFGPTLSSFTPQSITVDEVSWKFPWLVSAWGEVLEMSNTATGPGVGETSFPYSVALNISDDVSWRLYPYTGFIEF